MTMTPDEVVDVLEKLNCILADKQWVTEKQHESVDSAIALIQDYQKLRGRIDVDELSFLIYKHETGLGEELARANWTAKHFRDKSKVNSTPLAQAIVTYLQQPTEH